MRSCLNQIRNLLKLETEGEDVVQINKDNDGEEIEREKREDISREIVIILESIPSE